MANKEKVDIKRSDTFQEVDDELTRAMAELDSTIERVSLIFQPESDALAASEGAPKLIDDQEVELAPTEPAESEEQATSSEER